MAHSTNKQSREKGALQYRPADIKDPHFSYLAEYGDTLMKAFGIHLPPSLLINALTHRSFAHENPGVENNERLEFLGDSVLGFIVTGILYDQFPENSEGDLTRMRAGIVCESTMATIARQKLHLGEYLLLGKGEMKDGGGDKDSLLCDALEALIGATYLSHGIEETRQVVLSLLADTIDVVTHNRVIEDWKTTLLVLTHELNMAEPEYRTEMDNNPTTPVFTARVYSGNRELACAQGSSKRKAQMEAAHLAVSDLSALKEKKLAEGITFSKKKHRWNINIFNRTQS